VRGLAWHAVASQTGGDFVGAAGRSRLTALYDPVMSLTMRERRWRPQLVTQTLADPAPRTILDLGCGTATLTVELARSAPAASVIGLDADEQMLVRASRKAQEHRVDVRFLRGLANQLPLRDGSCDRVVSALVFHHLSDDAKRQALAEALRVLRPRGRLHVADWGRPANAVMAGAFLGVRLLDGFDNTRVHADGQLPRLVAKTGFQDVHVRARLPTVWGTLELIQATRT
jgi:SAM-dependent methyltransferase